MRWVVGWLLCLTLLAGAQDLRSVEQRILEHANQERQEMGLRPLPELPALSEVARRHSQEMVKLNYFAHQSPTGTFPADRVQAGGVQARGIVENLGRFEKSWPASEFNWMRRPDQRRNLLREINVAIGVGAALAPNGDVLVTQLVCAEVGAPNPGAAYGEERSGSGERIAQPTGSGAYTSEERSRGLALARQVPFPEAVLYDAAQARSLEYLAENPPSPEVLWASLSALRGLYSPNPGAGAGRPDGTVYKRLPLDPEFRRITLKYLHSQDPRAFDQALLLAAHLTWGAHPDDEVMEALVDVLRRAPDASSRGKAMGALMDSHVDHPALRAGLLLALADRSTYVTDMALADLPRKVALFDSAFRTELEGKMEGLLRGPVPIVRARALDVVAALALPGARLKLEQALHDPDGAVRASAAQALGTLGDKAALPALMFLVNDTGGTQYSFVIGPRDRVDYQIGSGQVNDLVLRAIARLSGGEFQYQLQDAAKRSLTPAQREIVRSEARRASQWYGGRR